MPLHCQGIDLKNTSTLTAGINLFLSKRKRRSKVMSKKDSNKIKKCSNSSMKSNDKYGYRKHYHTHAYAVPCPNCGTDNHACVDRCINCNYCLTCD